MTKEKKAKNGSFNIKRFSEDIYAYRMKKGMTLQVFSEWAELSLSTVQRAEAGKNIDIATLVAICNHLDTQVQTYFK